MSPNTPGSGLTNKGLDAYMPAFLKRLARQAQRNPDALSHGWWDDGAYDDPNEPPIEDMIKRLRELVVLPTAQATNEVGPGPDPDPFGDEQGRHRTGMDPESPVRPKGGPNFVDPLTSIHLRPGDGFLPDTRPNPPSLVALLLAALQYRVPDPTTNGLILTAQEIDLELKRYKPLSDPFAAILNKLDAIHAALNERGGL